MNFSKMPNSTWWGRAIRFPLRLIPPGLVISIFQGPLKGKKWIAGSSVNGCWLGSYEYEKQRIFSATILDSSVVYDIGAHAGFYTLLASKLVGLHGKVLAFEPLPENLMFLKEHLRINNISNVEVFNVAISDSSGTFMFEEGVHSSMGRLSDRGIIPVLTTTLDKLIDNSQLPLPDIIKMDIEGEELSALRGAEKLIEKKHPVIFLATHGDVIHQQCCDLLTDYGYVLSAIDGHDLEFSTEVLAKYFES
jgi:FkbM family methyltransferase